MIRPKLLLLLSVSVLTVTPFVTTLEEVTPKEPMEAPTERALAKSLVAVVAEVVEVEVLPELGSASPSIKIEAERMEVKVMASTRCVLSFMALSSQETRVSMTMRTEAGSLALRVKLKPTLTLFWHIQFFLVKPATQEVQ